MRKTIKFTLGFILIVPGLFMLLDSFNIFSIRDFIDFTYIFKHYWPTLFFVVPAQYMHFLFFADDKKNPGLLMGGGFLGISGITMQLSYSYGLWGKLWPGFILSASIGLMEYYWFGKREKGVLISVVIITGVAAAMFSKTMTNSFYGDYITALALIALGLIVIFDNRLKKVEFK